MRGREDSVKAQRLRTLFDEALQIYLEAMRSLIRTRLEAQFGDRWWEDGVLATLTQEGRRILLDDIRIFPRDLIDHIDPRRMIDVILRSNYDTCFQSFFPDWRMTKSRLELIRGHRNLWAHSDMSIEDVEEAFLAMEQLLRSAGLLREVNKIKHRRRSAAPADGPPTPPPPPPPPARRDGRYRWSEDDDLVGLYLYRCGSDDLGLSEDEIGEGLGMGAGSMLMKISNFQYFDQGVGLSGGSQQSRRVYVNYQRATCEEMAARVREYLKKKLGT